jgi:hypothetical protein
MHNTAAAASDLRGAQHPNTGPRRYLTRKGRHPLAALARTECQILRLDKLNAATQSFCITD